MSLPFTRLQPRLAPALLLLAAGCSAEQAPAPAIDAPPVEPAIEAPPPAPATPSMTATEATSVFQRIRSTPAELALHCEQLRLQGDSIDAYRSADNAAASRMGLRIGDIQTQLIGYKAAFSFYSGKAGDMDFYRSAEGRALDQAQRALDKACPTPALRR